MGIINGLFAGRSGIQSHGAAISVLADNIANSNTVGFKPSRADFSDILASSLSNKGSADLSVGAGSQLQAVTQVLNQGSFEFTGRGLDVGIDGGGFFVVESPAGARYFTRAGNFLVNDDGQLTNQNGYSVMGFAANGSGALEPLDVNSVAQTAADSSEVAIGGNLDAATAITAVPGGSPSFATLATAASFSTSVDVFDSLGAQHNVSVFFFKTAANTWTANAYVDAGEVGGTAGDPSLIGSTTALTFDSDGSRAAFTPPDFTAAAAWDNGSDAASIEFSFDPFTQFSTSSAINSITQDGTGTGSIIAFSIEGDGTLFAQLSNGQSTSIGTIALANFASPEGLTRTNGSLYQSGTESGEAVIGTPDSGKFGVLQSGALELSTADIADDFIKLISLQRGFQGSSRIITSIDQLLSEIIQLAG